MGQVWRGTHRDHGVNVALKALTSEVARDARVAASFRNEARLVAGLEHPGVVLVFDYGTISEEVASASGRALEAGSPYLVMEWASGGTLASAAPESWPEFRSALLSVLVALAHAHARGI